MKNLFLVINKEKIYAYVVSIMTIVVIFFMSSMLNSGLEETETTSTNSIDNVQKNEIIQNVDNVQDIENEQSTDKNESVETSGVIGEAISTSNPSNEQTEENPIDEPVSTEN